LFSSLVVSGLVIRKHAWLSVQSREGAYLRRLEKIALH
jgi:hypothetical protein